MGASLPRVAVVTGASSGIGEALAEHMAAQGVAVGLTARRSDLLHALRRRIEAAGGRAAVAEADAQDRAATIAAIHNLESVLGPVDLLVMNAGVGLSSFLQDPDASGYETMVRVNLLGPHYAAEAVVPGMLERGSGHLVAISSLAARITGPGSGGYSATKAGLSSWMESIRLELAPHGIACTTIQPGFVQTAMTDQNDFEMPLLMQPERAAQVIWRAIRKQKAVYDFPWRMSLAARVLRRLPRGLRARLMKRGTEESHD